MIFVLGAFVLVGVGTGGYFWWQKRVEAREKAEWAAMPVQKLDEVAPPKPSRSMDFPDIEPDRDEEI